MTLGAVRDHHRGDDEDDELEAHPRHLFGSAIAAVRFALSGIEPAVAELETLWADRGDLTVPQWERRHIPPPMRAHITALEGVTRAMSGLCFDVYADPDD